MSHSLGLGPACATPSLLSYGMLSSLRNFSSSVVKNILVEA